MYKVVDCNQLPSPLPLQAVVELLWQTRKSEWSYLEPVFVCPLWSTVVKKLHFKQYLNEHKNIFQNVDQTKFYITSV